MGMEKIEKMEEECMSEAEWINRKRKIVVDHERIKDIIILQMISLSISLIILFL